MTRRKFNLKAGIIFGTAMSIYSILQYFLTHDNLLTKNIVIFIISALIGGALGGLIFGWLIALLANSKRITQTSKIETGSDEAIILETDANHFKGIEGVGGKLYLTNKRLVFKSHKLNIQNHEISIGLSDINKVDRYKTLGLINNGLNVTTSNNNIERFVVQQIDELINKLSANH